MNGGYMLMEELFILKKGGELGFTKTTVALACQRLDLLYVGK